MKTAAISLVIVLGLAGCKKETTAQAPARPVKVYRVESQAAEGGLRYSASFQPQEQVQLAFKVGGYVRKILQRTGIDGRSRNLQLGDEVRQGAVLARIREADYQQKVNEARAQRAASAASLEKARADMNRAQQLYDTKSLTRTDYDSAKAALEVAAANLQAADSGLALAELALSDCALRAPLDAVVLSRNVEVGTLAAAGAVGFVLADITRVKAVFGVPDQVAGRLKVGQALELAAETSDPMQGRVTAISPSADAQSRAFNVEVTIPNPKRQLKPGMIAAVAVPSSSKEPPGADLLAVPLSAVVRSRVKPDGYALFVVDDQAGRSVARARDVELGQITGNMIAVAGGLRRDERVIVTGASLVSDGEAVSVIE